MNINQAIAYGVLGFIAFACISLFSYLTTEKIPEGIRHPPITILFESIGAFGMIGSVIFIIANVLKELGVA